MEKITTNSTEKFKDQIMIYADVVPVPLVEATEADNSDTSDSEAAGSESQPVTDGSQSVQVVASVIDVSIRKVTTTNSTVVTAEMQKDNEGVGTFIYDSTIGYLNISFKPFGRLNTKEMRTVADKIPEYIDELTR